MIYKIPLQCYISATVICFFLASYTIEAQQFTTSPYGVQVIDKTNSFRQSVQADSARKMLELSLVIPDIIYDLRYATTNNFMHRRMYPANTRTTFLRAPAAYALAQIQQELHLKGYGLKIFDAYRPYSVTVSFWELIKDERYVANPSKGSGHNRGLAVDLTIVDLQTGKELDMGTGFDNFTDSAHHNFTQLPQLVLQNRQLLKETMQKYGFTLLETEWWHYYWPNNRNYDVLDIPFNQLKKQ